MNWIEVSIFQKDLRQDILEDIVMVLYNEIIYPYKIEGMIESWHFFREPELRFRIELKSEENKEKAKKDLADNLERIKNKGLITKWYFSRHGREGEEYNGEEDFYGKVLFKKQKDLWHNFAELFVKMKTMENLQIMEKSRDFQYKRLRHLLANILGVDEFE